MAMFHACTEDQLVEQPAKAEGPPSPWSFAFGYLRFAPVPSGRGNDGLFVELGRAIAFGNPHPGPLPEGEGVSGVGLLPSTSGRGVGGEGAALIAPLLGRETKSEVVLKPRLEAALRRLNPALAPEAITAAVSEIGPVSTAGETGETPAQITGHESGHKTRQESGIFSSNGLFSGVNTDNDPDIYADI